LDYKFEMYCKVSEIANKYRFTAAMLGGTTPDLADIVIHIDDYCMIGLKLNPSSSKKPFNLYPYGIDVDFDELNDYLQGHKWGQEIVNDAGQETI
jgi:hypothetical protein